MSQPTQVYCSPHSCYTVHTSNITNLNHKIKKSGKARNRTKRSAPPTQKPLNSDNFRNKLPGQSASLSDLTDLEDHLMMLLQSTTYNTILLQQQISNLQNTIHYMVASLGKLDDSLLANIWSHHFTTEFLNYDHFNIRPKSFPSIPNSNCKGSQIYHCGRFIPKGKKDKCVTWTESTPIQLFNSSQFILTNFSHINHTTVNQEIGWSFVVDHKDGLAEAAVLRSYGGFQNSAVIDILGYREGSIN